MTPHVLLRQVLGAEVALVHLEPDGVLGLSLALPLQQGHDDRAVHLVVVRVGVAQVDEELRVGGVAAHAVVAAPAGGGPAPPAAVEVEDLEPLHVVRHLHRVGAQVAQLKLAKVPVTSSSLLSGSNQ